MWTVDLEFDSRGVYRNFLGREPAQGEIFGKVDISKKISRVKKKADA